MAVLLPLPPRELDGWPGGEGADWEAVLRLRRHLATQAPWAQGSLTGLIARNERLKELAP
jgi:hypothetical protein